MSGAVQQEWMSSLETCLDTLEQRIALNGEKLLVIGVSTSEVIGKQIGSHSSDEVARVLYEVFAQFQQKTKVHLAFQCCEHLNRALVVERETVRLFHLEEVTAVPHRNAGGSMATYAYQQMKDPVLVEQVAAHAGIDIGDTLIGMHLKRVAVPLRSEVSTIGKAHVTMAYTRPKLIGGPRASYPKEIKS